MRRGLVWAGVVAVLALTVVLAAAGAGQRFVIALDLPSFGGPVTVTLEAPTADGCWKLRRAAQSFIHENGVKAHVSACAE